MAARNMTTGLFLVLMFALLVLYLMNVRRSEVAAVQSAEAASLVESLDGFCHEICLSRAQSAKRLVQEE